MVRLALALGKTIREIEALDARELAEWMAYARLEPFGPLQEDFRAGQIAAMVASPYLPKEKRVSAADFFPSLKLRRTDEKQAAKDAAWAERLRARAKADTRR